MRHFRELNWVAILVVVLSVSLSCTAAEIADEVFSIGPRRSAPARVWFKQSQKLDDAFYREALDAARLLAAPENLDKTAELEDLKSAIAGHKELCGQAFLWLLDAKHCSDPVARRGALTGLTFSETDAKVAGKFVGGAAVFDPDKSVKTAAINLIKTQKDSLAAYAETAIITAWKSSFDNSGIPTVNEEQRKSAVAAMHDLDDKRVFEVLVWYATLELRAQSATPVRIDQVAITGQNINLPIDLPVIDIISAEGTIAVPALASLKAATGQDFGHNLDKWNAWLAQKK